MNLLDRSRALLARHKKMVITVAIIYVVAMIILVVISAGPQTEPFQYQVR